MHVPQWFAVLGALLVMGSVAGTALSLAALWAEFRSHARQEWHDAAQADIRAMLDSLVESQATQEHVIRRLDELDRRIEHEEERKR